MLGILFNSIELVTVAIKVVSRRSAETQSLTPEETAAANLAFDQDQAHPPAEG